MTVRLKLDMEAVVRDRASMNLHQIAAKYCTTAGTVCKRLKEYETGRPYVPGVASRRGAVRVSVAELAADPSAIHQFPSSVAEAEKIFRKLIGYAGKPPKPAPAILPGGHRKILLLNDLHVPFHHEAALAWAMEEHGDADLLLLGGDLMDLYSVSRFVRFHQRHTPEEELRAGKAFLNILSSKFPKVKIMPGNHDERFRKHIVARGLDAYDLQALIYLGQQASGREDANVTDVLSCLAYDLPNVEVAPPIVRDCAEFTFLMQEGDLIVSHAEKFSQMTGRAANQVGSWLESCALKMDPPLVQPFRVVAQCHTHQASTQWSNSGWTMECGCMSVTPDYAASPKLHGAGRPSVLGCSVFYQDATGRTNMRESRFIPFKG